MNDFIDPDPIPGAVQAPERPDVQPIWPGTVSRFTFLEDAGAVAHLDSLRSPGMVPTLALELVAATLGEDSFRQVAIQPRRGTPFYVVLHRRKGLIYAQ